MTKEALFDAEFGEIPVRRNARGKYIRVKVTPHGKVTASMPRLASLRALKKLVDDSRSELRKGIVTMESQKPPVYRDGDAIGASHHLRFQVGSQQKVSVRGQNIVATIPENVDLLDPSVQDDIRRAVRRALDTEAKAYLTRRLVYLAENHGFSHKQLRFGNAKGRWGSCSSLGVISLNVALMRLPMHLIDYVLIHELSHTKHLNHSRRFWDEVAKAFPDYKNARVELKTHNPYL